MGNRYYSLNVPLLSHLTTSVKQLGPLWPISCFEFESANGNLINFCHGTRKIDLQVLIINIFHVATACMLVLF